MKKTTLAAALCVALPAYGGGLVVDFELGGAVRENTPPDVSTSDVIGSATIGDTSGTPEAAEDAFPLFAGLRAGGTHWKAYVHGWTGVGRNIGAGVEYATSWRQWRFGVGAGYYRDKTYDLGTHGNATVFLGYSISWLDGATLGWRHVSNCDVICGNGNDNWGREGKNRGKEIVAFQMSF